MNIFGKNSGIIINNCGGKSTVIVNGKVINSDGSTMNYKPFDKKQYVLENVTSIFVDTTSADVSFKVGEETFVRYFGKFADEEPELNIDIRGGQLTVKLDEGMYLQDTKLVITVPDKLNNIKIKTVSGDVDIDNFDLKELDISTVSGDIYSNCKTSTIYLKTVSGDINAKIDSKNVNVSSTSGDIEADLKDIKMGSFDTVSGDINVETNDIGANANIVSVSGRTKNKIKTADFSRIINASSISGDIYLF